MKTRTTIQQICATAIATGLLACAGCASHERISDREPESHSNATESADSPPHNRLLVRMALAENVYNGIAAEGAVYPHDFYSNGAGLNDLGRRRVDVLSAACREGGENPHLIILRGDASEELYDRRIDAVRKRLAETALEGETTEVAKADHVAGAGVSSDRAIITFARMMAEYVPRPQTSGATDTGMQQQSSSSQSDHGGTSSNNYRGQ
jgi:hypothetical protein